MSYVVKCSCGKISKRNYLTHKAATKHMESKHFAACQVNGSLYGGHYLRVERF